MCGSGSVHSWRWTLRNNEIIRFDLVNKRVYAPCLYNRRTVAQSVERATPGEEVPGSIPAMAARSLLVGSVSV